MLTVNGAAQLQLPATLLVSLTLLIKPCWTLIKHGGTGTEGWTQQYGDSFSTSYTGFVDNGQFMPGWNYTTRNFVSETSPSVNEYGVLFYPLRVFVIAIAPNGSTVWKCGVSPNGDSYLTNTLYSRVHNLVIVGSTWVQQNTFFQFVAINATSGNVVWTKMINELFHPTSISLSVKADSIFVAGFDKSTFAAVKITSGEILWEKKGIYEVGIFMQTKVGDIVSLKQQPNVPPTIKDTTKRDTVLSVNEVVLLPTNPWDGFEGKGRLFAYDTARGKPTNDSMS